MWSYTNTLSVFVFFASEYWMFLPEKYCYIGTDDIPFELFSTYHDNFLELMQFSWRMML
jgi:hypothetical protein